MQPFPSSQRKSIASETLSGGDALGAFQHLHRKPADGRGKFSEWQSFGVWHAFVDDDGY